MPASRAVIRVGVNYGIAVIFISLILLKARLYAPCLINKEDTVMPRLAKKKTNDHLYSSQKEKAVSTAREISDYIIQFFQDREDPITNLRLQKLLYYVQGWHLAIYNGKPAFEEPLQAWVHGPVQPAIYAKYKKYRWAPISEEIGSLHINAKLRKHIEEVLAVYGIEPTYSLERMTHSEPPWKAARGKLPADASSTTEITKASMERFFKELGSGQASGA